MCMCACMAGVPKTLEGALGYPISCNFVCVWGGGGGGRGKGECRGCVQLLQRNSRPITCTSRHNICPCTELSHNHTAGPRSAIGRAPGS